MAPALSPFVGQQFTMSRLEVLFALEIGSERIVTLVVEDERLPILLSWEDDAEASTVWFVVRDEVDEAAGYGWFLIKVKVTYVHNQPVATVRSVEPFDLSQKDHIGIASFVYWKSTIIWVDLDGVMCRASWQRWTSHDIVRCCILVPGQKDVPTQWKVVTIVLSDPNNIAAGGYVVLESIEPCTDIKQMRIGVAGRPA